MAKIKLTYNQALSIQNTIISKNGQQQTVKSDLAKAKGDTGVKVYHLRHDIREKFKPFDEQRNELVKDAQALREEKEEANKKRASEIEKELADIEEEFSSIGQQEKELSLTKGKLNLSEIKTLVDGIELEILEPVIDFNK